MFLAEKAVSVETIEVTIASAANRQPTYLAKNPLGLLPILELEDGRILRESMAICHYVDELHPEPNLFGADPWERAMIEQWNRHAELEVLFPIAQVFRNTHAFWQGRIKQVPEFGAVMKEQVFERMAWFDDELGRRSHVAGDRFSVADITLLCAIDFGKVSDIRITDTYPNLKRWHAEISARPSAKA
jgi:glutathione S-transferase